MSEGLLIKQEKYLETGIHIGTKLRTIDMAKFIYRTRNDGLYVLDLRAIDERIRLAGKVMAKYPPEDTVIIASRTYSSIAARVFAKITGVKVIYGRFVPGLFTNVARADFIEPKLAFICDPKGERQAVIECGKMGIPSIGLCDTDNFTMFVDWAIPCNNKGRRALALIFWLLAREMAMGAGKISTYEEFTPDFEAFEAMANEIAEQESTRKSVKGGEDDSSVQGEVQEEPSGNEEELEGKEEPAEGKEEQAEKKEAKKPAKAKRAAKKAKTQEAEPEIKEADAATGEKGESSSDEPGEQGKEAQSDASGAETPAKGGEDASTWDVEPKSD
ncbi:MAG: 30S ribosomal protein S2 [Candidatus Micrarchaeota archaeon]